MRRPFTSMILSLPLENRVAGVLRTINDRLADAVTAMNLEFYTAEITMKKKSWGSSSR